MLVQYLVMHQSCRNHPGVLAVQAAHAAAEAIRETPVPSDTTVVVLVADKSDDLERVSGELELAGVRHVVIREPDEPYFGAATALGVEPMEREKVSQLLRGFKVLR